MKEITTINIAGIIFHIDMDAYEQLKNYFNKLKNKFGASSTSKEIINDIELRIAELLQEKLNDSKEAISLEDVEEVIKTMGAPEDIDAEEDQGDQTDNYSTSNRFSQKQLYRDGDNRVFGGICSGMAHYFRIDPIILRILAVAFTLTFGVGVLVYIILWIVIPKAETTSQKLEMMGEPVNANNIKKTVQQSYEELKSSPGYKKASVGINNGLSTIGIVLQYVLRAFVVIIGIGLLIGGVSAIVGILNVAVFNVPWITFNVNSASTFIPVLNGVIDNNVLFGLFVLACLLLIIIPILLVLFIAVKLIFRFKTNNRIIGLSSLGLWLLSLATVITFAISTARQYSTSSSVDEKIELKKTNSKILYIDINKDMPDFTKSVNGLYFSKTDSGTFLYKQVDFDIERSNSENLELYITKQARASSYRKAEAIAKSIHYTFSQNDSLVILNRYFFEGIKNAGHSYNVDVTLRLPVGYKVYMYKELTPIICDIDNVANMWDGDMVDKTWEMKPEGLTQVK